MIEQRDSVAQTHSVRREPTQTHSVRREPTQKGRKRKKREDREALWMSGQGRMRLTRRHLRCEVVIPEN